jgi:plastocyanin
MESPFDAPRGGRITMPTHRGISKLVLTMAVLALVGAACSSSSSSTTTGGGATTPVETTPASSPSETVGEAGPTPTTLGTEQANFVKQEDASGMSSIEIEADTDNNVNYFSPTIVTGTAGQQLSIELKNASDSVKHNFIVEGQSINEDLDPGQTATVTVTLPASGVLEFHCEYHQSIGMVGQFQVGA